MAIPKTTLWLSPQILKELMFYAWKVDAEVGGLGHLKFDKKENDIVVTELYLLDQEVHNAECELSSKGISNLYDELISAGEDAKIGDINFWWHSHKTMDAFFSGTDDTTMKEWNGSYLVALVINRDGKMKAKMLSRVPVMVIGDIDIAVDWFDVPEHDAWEASVNERVKEIKFQVVAKPNAVQQYPKYPQYNQAWYDTEYADWRDYTGKEKSVHDMTDAEFKKAMEEDEVDAEVKALFGPEILSGRISDEEMDYLKAQWND